MTTMLSKLKELDNECSQQNCNNTSTHTIYWPNKTVKCCKEHAERAILIAIAMGFALHVEEIKC